MSGRLPKIRTIGLYLMALLLAAGYPSITMAQSPEVTTETTTTEQVAETTAPVEPEHTYTYDPVTQTWSTEEWKYNPETGTYEAVPPPLVIEPVVEETLADETVTDVTTEVEVTNELDSEATTGDATVATNTTGGNATTGDALAMSTMITSANSVITSAPNQEVAQFTQDIYGDVTGDIMLYPMLLKTMLEQELQQSLQINATTDMQVNNTIDLLAQSGDALVTTNTTAGNATSGSADAVANLITILNSMIATQQSFVGTINIYGNLEGDILIAPDFIPQMIASNGGSDSITQVSSQDTKTIVNDISVMAESGAAAVLANTEAGNATTGNADTNVVIFNLTGHEIVAANSLLVFVNVLGQWVGVIVDAPSGATAALIGDGVVSATQTQPELTISADTTQGIHNTVNVTALTGDAEVSKNTKAGNATTGPATASANIANIMGSQLSMTGWFGVLFINVFQNWYGSFGVNTAYGNPPAQPTTEGGAAPGVIQFIPKEEKAASTPTLTLVDRRWIDVSTDESVEETNAATAVLASASGGPAGTKTAPRAEQPETLMQDSRLWIAAGSLLIIGLSAVGLRRMFASQGVDVAGTE